MKALIIIIVVAALGGGGTLVFKQVNSTSNAPGAIAGEVLFATARGTLTVTVTENGALMAKNSEKITSKSRRGGKITFLVEEGKTVEEGETLCTLDATDLNHQQQELELNIVKTEADLDTAKTELDIQTSENVATIEKAGIALDRAEKEEERYRDGDAPKERRKLEIAIKEAENKFSRDKKKYEDSIKLLEKDYITGSQAEQDQIDYERSEIQLEAARRDLDIFEKYTLPMTMTEKRTGVTDKQRELDNAEKRAKSILRQKEVAVESQDSRLTRLKKQLDEVKEEIANFTITAPSPGIVIYGDPNQPWRREDIKIGGQIWGGMTLFTIPDLRVMQVQVQIHEADISKIAEEQAATITMDTYAGLVLTGKVAKIATLAGGGNSRQNSEVKKFTVDIVLDSTEGQTLKPGISAKAEIFIDERKDVLYVPIQCVFLDDGRYHAYVSDATGAPATVEVEVGASNDTYIEITRGLSEGDRVLLYNPAIDTQGTRLSDEEEAQTPDDEPDDAPEPAVPVTGSAPAGG